MDIRAGLSPAERPADLSPDLESIWGRLEDCWDLDSSNRPSAASLLAWFKGRASCLFREPLASEQASDDADLVGTAEESLGSLDKNILQEFAAGTILEEANSPGMVPISFLFLNCL
jgi:hypothetical protein